MLGLCLIAALAQAAPETAPRPEEPDADFLDFLGSWKNQDGRWVDPFRVAEDLHRGTRPKLNRDNQDSGPRMGGSSKGIEPNQNPDKPREPIRARTDP